MKKIAVIIIGLFSIVTFSQNIEKHTADFSDLITIIENLLGRNLLEAYFINYFPYHIDYAQITMICFISFVISIISSLVPSFRAIKLNPVEILRHE